MVRFFLNLHITLQGLLVEGKNDRLILNGWFIPNWKAVCINMMLSHESDPKIIYADIFKRHLQYLQNTWITVPKDVILIYDDDVNSVFRHYKCHPDIASIFAFILQHLLYIWLGGSFGSIITLSNFEPIARVRIHLAEYY